jgi:hypothetical protein
LAGYSLRYRLTLGMVLSTTWLEFKDMAQDPLDRREQVSASCKRRPNEGLETQKYSQTYIGQPVLFEYGTGCEWHPSNQTLQCPILTIRCYPWSAGSWQVQVWPLCLISTSHAREPCLSRITQNSVCSLFEFKYLSPVF